MNDRESDRIKTPFVTCPECGGHRLLRYGKTRAGKQKLKCVSRALFRDGHIGECGRQFVVMASHGVDPKTIEVVIGLLHTGVPPAKIAASVRGISKRWIYELKKRIRG